MRHYYGLGLRPKKADKYGHLLAEALLKLARSDLSLAQANATIQELRGSFNFVFSRRRCLWFPGYLRLHTKTIGLCLKCMPLLRRLPVVISHNDLHSKNISISGQDECARITFLDLGMISLNYAGADLYYLLRQTTGKQYWKSAYNTALQEYSLGMHCNPNLISLAAHCYALLRLLKSVRAAIQNGQNDKQINNKLMQTNRLYQSGRKLLEELR